MTYLISKSKLNDIYFKKYNNLFNYSYTKFNLINLNLLFNFINTDNNTICKISFNNFDLKHITIFSPLFIV